MGLAIAALAALSGCSIAIPSSVPETTAQPAPPPTYAAPTVVAGHDAAAVAAAPMTFAAGTTLSPGVAVEFSDILGQPPQDYAQTPGPPAWKLLKKNVAGQTQYSNDAGCQLAHWTTSNQGPLITQGDDKASSTALLKYLIPSVMDSALTEAALPWVADAGNPGPNIAFLAFNTKAAQGVKASTVWARMLGTADTGLLVTLACPSDALLASATPAVMKKLSVAPPSN